MKKIVDSGNHCNYFQSKIIYLYGRMDNVKIRIAQLGFEVGLNLQYEIPNISSRHFGCFDCGETTCIKKHFHEIFEEISIMKSDVDRISELKYPE